MIKTIIRLILSCGTKCLDWDFVHYKWSYQVKSIFIYWRKNYFEDNFHCFKKNRYQSTIISMISRQCEQNDFFH